MAPIPITVDLLLIEQWDCGCELYASAGCLGVTFRRYCRRHTRWRRRPAAAPGVPVEVPA